MKARGLAVLATVAVRDQIRVKQWAPKFFCALAQFVAKL
jgi:hypothetical protein